MSKDSKVIELFDYKAPPVWKRIFGWWKSRKMRQYRYYQTTETIISPSVMEKSK